MLTECKKSTLKGMGFNFTKVHPSWHACLESSFATMDPAYLDTLISSHDWLPGPQYLLNAFSLPFNEVNYVLFGESPYPRRESAIGYAFWDAAVHELWSTTGLSKKVNRATSLRHLLKMLLVAEGVLSKENTGQASIARLDKSHLIQTNDELFANFQRHGFLLLNACLVLREGQKTKDAKAWQPFIKALLAQLLNRRPQITLIFLGSIALQIEKLMPNITVKKIFAEHPYNHTFVSNQMMLDFFQPLHLLRIHKSAKIS